MLQVLACTNDRQVGTYGRARVGASGRIVRVAVRVHTRQDRHVHTDWCGSLLACYFDLQGRSNQFGMQVWGLLREAGVPQRLLEEAIICEVHVSE